MKTIIKRLTSISSFTIITFFLLNCSNTYEKYLVKSGENESEIKIAIENCNENQKDGLAFLLQNMPDRDLKALSSKFILENLDYAYKALDNVKWKNEISNEIFFNYILPYSNIHERRDNWRKDFYNRFFKYIKNVKTPSEAALILNKTIWDILKVKYSTKRPKADQSPYETIDAGLASCTGLSILFVDVCRSVGIPARFVGIPLWKDKSGNHSWVEIWDKGWHYIGAAEISELNKTWFTEKAALADDLNWQNSIYAVSYKKTDVTFPALFDSTVNYIYADIITNRYNKNIQENGKVYLGVRVFKKNIRVKALAELLQNGEIILSGDTKDESHDYNDFLTFELPPQKSYEIIVNYNGEKKKRVITTNTEKYQFLNIELN